MTRKGDGAADLDFRRPEVGSALRGLLAALRAADYAFVVPTPETHRRVVEREMGPACSLRDVFGWSRPFEADRLGALFAPLRSAGVIAPAGKLWRSRVRVASASGDLFLHSAFPTDAADSVFLGPDSYRFVRWLRDRLEGEALGRAVDFGTGAGIGGVALARLASLAGLTLIDINPQAAALAAVNVEFAGVAADVLCAGDLRGACPPVDLVIGNPPFIAGSGKTYSDGGGSSGSEVTLDWARAALDVLAPGGRIVMYSGSSIVAGRDPLLAGLTRLAETAGGGLHYEEIDPDIFGEELSKPAYQGVDRIAAVGADIRLPH